MSKRDQVGLSVMLLVRNAEENLPAACRQCDALAQIAADLRPNFPPQPEILVFDHDSTDNSLSALQLLARKHPQLRIFAHSERGSAIKRGARCARGNYWLIADSALSPDLSRWTLRELLDGQPAAIIGGQMLGLPRELGAEALSWHRGGLWSAQLRVTQLLNQRYLGPVRKNPRLSGKLGRLQLEMQARLQRAIPRRGP